MRVITCLALTIGIMGLWLVDISASQFHPYLYSGFASISGIRLFHIGMWLSLVSLVFLALWNVRE